MYMSTALATLLVLQCCDLCVTIRVPIYWDNGDNSEVNDKQNDYSVVTIKPDAQFTQQKPIPLEYFEYTAKKPQFAIDVAAFHGVQSPETHYKAYPIRPYTGQEKPDLGKHRLQDQNRDIYRPLQKFTKSVGNLQNHVTPVISDYEVFHPYKAEEPALQELYKDPVFHKIRNDLRDASKNIENYEKKEEKPNNTKDEYLESPDQIDQKKIPHRNVPTQFEIHRPQRRPIYYKRLPKFRNRDQILNHKFKHPWNQNYVKIRPVHYNPLKNYLQRLRQHQALTYDDERNEYPQVPVKEDIIEPSDGYDIYENGKAKYMQLRNNIDESINKAVVANRPLISQNLELQNEDQPPEDEENEFVPVKNYAQVRKTETTKHLPKEAAFEDADSYEEIRNAPRLKEAVKTTKAQTVYTEEGYEDSAYDHAGEQKHASDHEGHGGYLKEQEISGGKYKIPTVSGSFDDAHGSAYQNNKLHGTKWKHSDENNKENIDSEDYSENDQQQSVEAKIYKEGINDSSNDDDESETDLENTNDMNNHDVNKREANFKVPEINLNTTYLTEDEILEIAKEKVIINNDFKLKYPYYHKKLKSLNKDSPLRYAENLKLIPKKSEGGTEFYDSRSQLVCPEVDENVDAIPNKLKRKGHPDGDENSAQNDEKEIEVLEEQPRLKRLGDKIDCFKAKYFGENPLDSPFFKEELIANPDPIILPNIPTYKIKENREQFSLKPIINTINKEKNNKNSKRDVYDLIDKLRNKQFTPKESLKNDSDYLRLLLISPQDTSINNSQILQESRFSMDLIDNIEDNTSNFTSNTDKNKTDINLLNDTVHNKSDGNVTYEFFKNKEEIKKISKSNRKKRAAPFIYEPYKIIRDGQIQESKRTTTSSNISPLIKQLQSSNVADKFTNVNQDKNSTKQNNSRMYKDIGKRDREQSKNSKENIGTSVRIVDVNIDKRRGEPRYEIRPSNHKWQYSPVENRKAMSVKDYEAQTNSKRNKDKLQSRSLSLNRNKSDFTQEDIQTPAASNTIKKTIITTTTPPASEINNNSDESEEEYDEYEEEDEEEKVEIITTTTTTTPKPIFRRKLKTTTTTEQNVKVESATTEIPKLRLVTRFRNSPHVHEDKHEQKNNSKANTYNDANNSPKYREKKKKSTKSTLVTDTKSYGEDDDNMREEEVDALIGVKQDMNDYMPLYEKEAREKENQSIRSSEENSSEEDDYEDEDDESGIEDDEDEDDEDDEDEEENVPILITTTPEPTKRTLIMTTSAPLSITEPVTTEPKRKPIVLKKKIEIHKELPVNKSSPHITQYKQDIKEIEIVKEMPRNIVHKMPKKNSELLELYKDENLAKNVNKLDAVEVFKEDLDLKNSPRHGGNYKSAKTVQQIKETPTSKLVHRDNSRVPKEDAEASQSEYKKSIEFDDDISSIRMHGGNLKAIANIKNYNKSDNKNVKLVELAEIPENNPIPVHSGNLRLLKDMKRRHVKENEKLIELSDDDVEDYDDVPSTHTDNYKPYSSRHGGGSMHGGNYKSARLVRTEKRKPESSAKKEQSNINVDSQKDPRAKAAVLLNSFAQAVPILTTTPAYILDPSKRMYYYVEA
ncbi:myb-like protein X [Achroia grisella]|uniref:myb-like protein X n=1 Tax=Achroia grisella TaxID=688607 RepID=UPI0027D3019A|nr:myb-like protein X [Achroia grisella]